MTRILRVLLLLAAALFINHVAAAVASDNNIHAMIVSSSRYWFNYRHAMNALGIYELMKQNGIPDSNMILMIADEYATNARNPYKNRMHAAGIHRESWYSADTELDYRGADVTVQTFLDALLGVAPKSLHTNENSTLLIYTTGHGGDQFFKFQDEEELTAQDIANLVERLHLDKKYKNLLFIADTCQAFTLFDKVTAPNVLALGTSLRGENAYAHHTDKELGLAAIERWTYHFLNAYKTKSNEQTTLYDIMKAPFQSKAVLGAQVGILENGIKFQDFKLAEFFGGKDGAKKQENVKATDAAATVPTVNRIDTTEATMQRRLTVELPKSAPVEADEPSTLAQETLSASSKDVSERPTEFDLLVPFSVVVAVLIVAATMEKKFFR